MLEYFRMVGKGGKEKEEKKLEVDESISPGNKPIDTASLIAALHPFGQGGVKLCSTCASSFTSPRVLALCDISLAQHNCVNRLIQTFGL